MERSDVARQLNAISEQLRSKYDAQALVLSQLAKVRSATFKNELTQGTSVSHAERMAEINTEALQVDNIKLKYNIQALEEARDHYRFVIKYNLEDFI